MKKHQTRWLLATLSQAALVTSVSHAQTTSDSVPSLSDTVVTASRIPQDPSLLPQGVTVITAKEIQAAGLTHANDAVRWLGGVPGRTDTSGGQDQTLDLRGFGDAAGSNLVILVDGVRQNEGDMTGSSLGWIPVGSIERIEIVRGGSAVLYGEGATAGAINIITNKGLAEPGGSISLGFGSLGTREAQASLNTVSGSWRFQLNGSSRDTDNHRENYANRESSALGRATWSDASAQFSVQLGVTGSKGRLPGGLSVADYLTNPGQTKTPDDRAESESTKLLISAEMPVSDWRLAADLSHRRSEIDGDYPSQPSLLSTKTEADRVGARAWREFKQGSATHKFLMGADVERWAQETDGLLFGFVNADPRITQLSNSIYGRHETLFEPQRLKAFAGVRRTTANRLSLGNPPGEFNAGETSWELGASKKLGPTSELFAKVGTSFRLPNANEYTCYVQFCPGGAGKLLPQTSKDADLGWRQKAMWGEWTARYYRNDLRREIGYDPMRGNVNFDPTRREGLELDASAQLSRSLNGGLQFAERRAVFRRGAYEGKTVPLVPHHTLTARLTYRQSATQQWVLSSQLVSSQRIGDDFNNVSSTRIPGYGILNLRYSQSVDAWTWAISGKNLLDKQYYNYRTYVNETYRSIYPEAGRTFLVSAERRF